MWGPWGTLARMRSDRMREVIDGVGVDRGAVEEEELLAAALLEAAENARHDVKAFFEFVMRHETTGQLLTCAPHQRVLFDFVEAHPRCVVRMPVGTAKTFSMAALTLHLLGRDPSARGAIVSATQGQAMKPLAMARDLIELSPELRMVFPKLRKSPRKTDPWTQSEITVDRPPGIRDPSLISVGIDGALAGARLSWIVVDDILDRENTASPAGLKKVHEWFDSTVLSRIDPHAGRIVVTNTPWHPDDVTYRLEEAGWPTLTMDVLGNIRLVNCGDTCIGCHGTWDSVEIVPSVRPGEVYRLAAHGEATNAEGSVVEETQPLWAARYTMQDIEALRGSHLPHRFNQLYLCLCRSDETAKCKIEWIDRCREQGRGLSLVSRYEGTNLTITGVDLAVGKGSQYDKTAFFTFELLEDGKRRILDIEAGQYDAPTIVNKLIAKCEAYKSLVMVENNACFEAGSCVLTSEGYVPIEQVREGALVWTHCERWRRVIEVKQGVARVRCEAKASGCLPVRTTPNHWFWMREAGRTPGRAGGHRRPVGEPAWVSVGFPEKEAYVGLAVPRWQATRAELAGAPVDTRRAVMLGLFMAEGHATNRQVFFTFARHEEHLVRFVREELRKLAPGATVSRRYGDGTLRVCASSTRLASIFREFGTREKKRPPLAWFGWPLARRLAMVRGWLMGDGCLRTNNAGTEWPRRFFSGSSISRDWMLFARTALIEAGFRPTLSASPGRDGVIAGRAIKSRRIFTLSLNAEDSAALSDTMGLIVERSHWPRVSKATRRSNSQMIVDQDGAWARLVSPTPGGPFDGEERAVWNLVVEEDESYVVEDYVVHNAQDYIRQFVLAKNVSIPVKAHTTGRGRSHPEYGVEGIFLEMQNGAWVIPSSRTGQVHPAVGEWIEECLYYTPDGHPGDVLMASWLGVELARQMGFGGRGRAAPPRAGLAASLLAR